MADLEYTYGPERPEKQEDYTAFRVERYIQGHANKIIHDLEKSARMYNGKLVRIFRPTASTRCPQCTDSITGARVLSNCSVCNGTGMQEGYSQLCEKWALIDVIPKYNLTTGLGNSDSPGGSKTPIVLIDTPILKDRDLIVTYYSKDVYKIVDVEPGIVAFQGIVITQVSQCNLISPGSKEYSVITW
jgi:hypothetical protein